jgi:hypothetical protein
MTGDHAPTPRVGPLGIGESWALVTALLYTATNLLLRAAAVDIDPWLATPIGGARRGRARRLTVERRRDPQAVRSPYSPAAASGVVKRTK